MLFGLYTSIFQRLTNDIYIGLIIKGIILGHLHDLIIPSKVEEDGLDIEGTKKSTRV